MSANEPRAIFPGTAGDPVAEGVAIRGRVAPQMGAATVMVSEVSTVLAALGKVGVSVALRLQYAVFSLRMAYCKHSMVISSFNATGGPGVQTEEVQTSWHSLAVDANTLKALRESSGAEKSFDDASQVVRTAMGLPRMCFKQVDLEIQTGLHLSNELLRSAASKLAAKLQKDAESLENRIPTYEPWVVQVFDKDKITENLCTPDWEPFARDWGVLSKQFATAKNLAHPYFGKFEALYPEPVKIALRCLASGRAFISVVSTVKLILIKLPTASKAQRLAMLETQMAKTSGSNLPSNLTDYMGREMSKLRA